MPNPGFETYTVCPGNYSQRANEFRVTDWYTANAGTPDHFHSCSVGEADVPYNWAGVSDAYEGDGYVGIFVWMSSNTNYREYLQCKLLESLKKDSTYLVGFRYKLSSYSKYAIDRMGILLTDSLVVKRHDQAWDIVPTLQLINDSALTQRTGYWEKAQFEFRANGEERFLTLGNFADNHTTQYYFIRHRPIQQDMLAHSAYYYIDDVTVVPKYSQQPLLQPALPPFEGNEIVLNTHYVLDNIRFEFNSFRLTSSSFDELDKLVLHLEDNPNHKILLYGHTDDVGSDGYNLSLSKNRSHTVAKYLIAQGISAARIETFGFGKRSPLIDATTEEARKINRRVEVKFVK